MATTVTMPQLGETVTEGTILSWPKQVGDTISEDEVLVEISTDKVDTEVPSPVAGVILDILVPEGETVKVGTPLIVIGEPGEQPAEAPAAAAPEPTPEPKPPAAPAAPEPPAAPPAPEPTPAPAAPEPPAAPPAPEPPATQPAGAPSVPEVPAAEAPRRFFSPVVRKLAREHNLDLSKIEGTGRDGRVTRNDVLAYIEAQKTAPAAAAAPAAPPAAAAQAPEAPVAPAPAAAEPAPAPASSELPLLPGDEVVDLDRLRVRIAENLVHAKRTTAHVWTSVEVDYENVQRVRLAKRAEFKEREGFSLTYLPFIARATIDALKAFPVVNSSFYLEQKKAVFHHEVNLGIAVDVDQKGLIVTNLRDADGLRLVGIARAIRDLATRARSGQLTPDDISGFTFTITNAGPFGSFMSAPVIPLPNVAIMSTDAVVKRPTVITDDKGQDSIAIHHIGYLGLSWDHRAFDGSTAVLFLRRVKENLETWDWNQELA